MKPRSGKEDVRKYNLVLPESLYNELIKLAEQEGTTIVHLIRQFIKLGLILIEMEKSKNAIIIVRDDDGETKLRFLR